MIADASYTELARVRAGNGYKADLHEILITSRNTALIIDLQRDPHRSLACRRPGRRAPRRGNHPGDRHPVGTRAVRVAQPRPRRARGVLRARRHRRQATSTTSTSTRSASTPTGTCSSPRRHTSAVYKVHRRTGEVIWRLGGTRSDFTLGPGVSFGYQHDARRHSDGTLTIFDNAASLPTQRGDRLAAAPSPARHVGKDGHARARLRRRRTCAPPGRWGTHSRSPTAALFVGWGTYPGFSEIGPDWSTPVRRPLRRHLGDLSCAPANPGSGVRRPARRSLRRRSADGTTLVYASWNGATEVARWQVRAGSSATDLRPLRTVTRRGFETSITLRAKPRFVAVAALDRQGVVLGASRPIRA